MNRHLIVLREQVVKLLKIQNAPLSYISAKTDNLNTNVIVTSINILSQAHTPPALWFSSYITHCNALTLQGKRRLQWIPRNIQELSAPKIPTINPTIHMHTVMKT